MVMNDMTDDGKTVLRTIDWSAPIEIEGVKAEYVGEHMNAHAVKWQAPNGEEIDGRFCLFNNDGTISKHSAHYGGGRDWRIRNVQPATQAQGQTLTAQEHLARMEALVRRMAALNPVTEVAMMHTQEFDEARALVAEMEPVVDGDLVRAKEIAAGIARVTFHANADIHAQIAKVANIMEMMTRASTEAERMVACAYRALKEQHP